MVNRMKVTKVADIPRLGWEGNYGADAWRFHAVDEYIKSEKDLGKRQRASYLASVIGMGEDCEIPADYDPLNFM